MRLQGPSVNPTAGNHRVRQCRPHAHRNTVRHSPVDAGRSSADEAHGADHPGFAAGLSGVWVVAEHVLFVEADYKCG